MSIDQQGGADKAIEVALNEYNRIWDYYHRQTDMWNEYAGNFYKASTLFSAAIGGVLTWAASDKGGEQASHFFLFLAFGGSISLFALGIVGFLTSRMMTTEIANSHIYLSQLNSLRHFLFRTAGVSGVTPIHLARDTHNNSVARGKRISENVKRVHSPAGVRTNDRVSVIHAITSVIVVLGCVLLTVGIYNLGGELKQIFDDLPVWLQAVTFAGSAVLGMILIDRMLSWHAGLHYAHYINSRRDIPEREWGDDFFRVG